MAGEFGGKNLVDNSGEWGFFKVTIPAGPTAISPSLATHGIPNKVKSCRVWHFSGTATFMNRSAAAATDIPLPTSVSSALQMPIDDLTKLSFIGTANDVVGLLWRS